MDARCDQFFWRLYLIVAHKEWREEIAVVEKALSEIWLYKWKKGSFRPFMLFKFIFQTIICTFTINKKT